MILCSDHSRYQYVVYNPVEIVCVCKACYVFYFIGCQSLWGMISLQKNVQFKVTEGLSPYGALIRLLKYGIITKKNKVYLPVVF